MIIAIIAILITYSIFGAFVAGLVVGCTASKEDYFEMKGEYWRDAISAFILWPLVLQLLNEDAKIAKSLRK